MQDTHDLDFAYRYPFSKEAREIIAQSAGSIDDNLISMGKLRVEEDLNRAEISHSRLNMVDIKKAYVLSYVYSRMIISAIGNQIHLDRYVRSEAKRARSALESDTLPNMIKLMAELDLRMSYSDGRFIISLPSFLTFSSGDQGLSLVKQELGKGLVYLDKENAMGLIEKAIAAEVRRKLPIPLSDLPKRIIAESKGVKLPKINTRVEIREGSYRWIEKILSNPIGDVRHRTVNLILAPYLTNIKGLSEEEAASIIIEFIERCKQINPDTKVNSSYIKYQCKYSKSKGMKPLSFEKARELYRGVLELD